jgi:hypothetical protein
MKPTPERLALVERLKATLRIPMTDDEKAVYASQQAEEDRKAWDRHYRRTEPQLELKVAA